MEKPCFFLLLGSVFFSSTLFAQPSVSYAAVVTGLSAPVEVVNAGDGTFRLFVVQQNGIIRVYDAANGGLQAAPFLDVSSLITYVGDERGLLSLAFHPAYETNGYFYVYYNNTSGAVTVARYHASGKSNTAESGSGIVMLTVAKPFPNHNGGHLQFAKDSTLYFATGDGGGANDPNNNAQNTLSRLGKMLRLKVYTDAAAPYFEAPDNNPFVGNAAYDSLIWAYGLRNPYRWSFDRLTGDVWIGDVGQGAKEEIDYRPASSTGGENYGWRCYEGSIHTPAVPFFCDPQPNVAPVYDYDNPGNSSSSVIGGYVYRGTQYPALYGYYFAADFYLGNLYLLKPDGAGGFITAVKTGLQNYIAGFGEGEDGSLYAVSQATNTLYKIVDPTVLPVTLGGFGGKRVAGGNELRWTTLAEHNLSRFVVEQSSDGRIYTDVGKITASGNGSGASYSFVHNGSLPTASFYRLRMVNEDGSFAYSPVVKINPDKNDVQLYPTAVRNGRLVLQSDKPLTKFQLLNSNGSLVFERTFAAAPGTLTLYLPSLPKGIYVARIIGETVAAQKLLIE